MAGEPAARARLRMALVLAAVSSCSTHRTALAQGTLMVQGAPLGSALLAENLAAPFWRELAAAPCNRARWAPDFSSSEAFQRSIQPLQLRLRRETGASFPPAGTILQRTTVRSTARYTIERIRFADRLPGSGTYAYLGRPVGEAYQNATAVILVHGSGIHPQEALGWPDEYRQDERFEGSTFTGLAAELLEAGYVVLIPWLADDELSDYWPRLQWEFLERTGESLRARTQGAGPYQFLLAQIQGAIDLLQGDEAIGATRIAVAGWAEGAAVATAAAAIDPRINGVVRLEAPLDRSALRATVDGTLGEAQFTHVDCALGDVETAALIAPRPLLFAYSDSDASVSRFARYQSRSVVDSIHAIYRRLGAAPGLVSVQRRNDWKAGGNRQVRVWLDSVLSHDSRDVPEIVVPSARPSSEGYHRFSPDSLRVARWAFAAGLGSCLAPKFVPNFSSLAAYTAGTDSLRKVVARAIRVEVPAPRSVRIVRRSTILTTAVYRLEFIAARSERTGIPLTGLLATPIDTRSTALPAVISLDGNVQLGQPLGLPAQERAPYLNAYALDLVTAGTIVFIPYIPVDFPEIAAAEVKARGLSDRTSMTYVLPLAFASIDLVLSFPNVDSKRIAVRGISYSGIAALYTAALDTRVTTLVYSNPVLTAQVLYKDAASSALASWWPEVCSTIDLVHTYLIAPRRFVRENGLQDINGYENQPIETIDWSRRVYGALGIPTQFQFVRHDGGHETRNDNLRLFNY